VLGKTIKGLSAPANAALGHPDIEIFRDVREHLGVVPEFFTLFRDNRLPEMWNRYKSVHLDPDTALDGKTKRLIALAVAAQAGCEGCIYFEASAAFANGATFQEVQEAIVIFVIENGWSEVLTEETFDMVKRDVDTLRSNGALVITVDPADVY
jgi:AhpD family alkylhydroperoxidase